MAPAFPSDAILPFFLSRPAFTLLSLLVCVLSAIHGVSSANVTNLLRDAEKKQNLRTFSQHTATNQSNVRSKLMTAITDGRERLLQPSKGANYSDGVTGSTVTEKVNVWYSTGDWLPPGGIRPDRSVNLAVLPMLALFFFVFGVCIKCYSWVRDQDRSKARGTLDFEDGDEVNYGIIIAGEQGYREVDIRSDSTSMYDTVTSFRSFRLPFNEHTVTSVKSLPAHDTYRSIVLQRADEGVYDSVQSYKAFLEKSISEVDIEVELVQHYSPRPRSKSYDQSLTSNDASARAKRHRRIRHHSGGRGLEGGAKTQTERERYRRHSDKSTPHHPAAPPPLSHPKAFHRRSSPTILEPLLQGTEFKIPLEYEEGEERGEGASPPPTHSPLHRQSSSSSSSSSTAAASSPSSRPPRHKDSAHRKKLRAKRASQDQLAERGAGIKAAGIVNPLERGTGIKAAGVVNPLERGAGIKAAGVNPLERGAGIKAAGVNPLERGAGIKAAGVNPLERGGNKAWDRAGISPAERAVKCASHSSGHCSDDSPQSSPSSKNSSSNELDSDSDVTDSGMVVDVHKPAKQSCFKNGNGNNGKGAGTGNVEEGGGGNREVLRKVHRFKVSFVEDATLSAASE